MNYVIHSIIAFTFILIFSPVMVIIYFTILVVYQYNPIYVAKRVGLGQKTFSYYKFQTMYPINSAKIKGNTDQERITRLGLVLRKYSLDELPSLLCVLLGNLSLVGPRPLPPVYNDLYSDRQRQRFLVKPGITGLAQISGRNSISWSKRFALDCFYVKKKSLCFDMIIGIKTVKKVIFAKDVHPTGASVVDNFNGKN